jgi:molecular chaperone DnaK
VGTVTYWLGIDLGTTYIAAALCRHAAGEAAELETEVVPLGSRSPATSSVLFLAGDGFPVVGEVAERRALTDPDRVVREFKRRIGDEIPLLVAGVSYQAHELAAMLAQWVLQRVTEREGEPPQGVALTCPASWGPFKTSLFEQAIRQTGIGNLALLSEPEAAAVSYASRERVEVGATLAVYDLGGGTFDAAVVRKDSPTTFSVLGRPEGVDGLGGITFDEAIFEHVCAAAGVPLSEIDPHDPDIVPEVARLRRECTEAKEALSVDTEATIPVMLGDIRQRVRVTRAEFEELIQPELEQTIAALRRALDSADVDSARLDAILLIGGSSRIPQVSQLISAEFDRAPAIDTDPKMAVAVGAARFIAAAGAPVPADWQATAPLPDAPPERPRLHTFLSGGEKADEQAVPVRRKPLFSAAVVILLVFIGAGATVLGTPRLASLFSDPTPANGATSVATPGLNRPAAAPGTTRHNTTGPRNASVISDPAAVVSSSHPGKGASSSTSVRSGKGGASTDASSAPPAGTHGPASAPSTSAPPPAPSPSMSLPSPSPAASGPSPASTPSSRPGATATR